LSWQVVVPDAGALAESPFWHPHELSLYWVDIPGRAVCRCNVFMGTVERWNLPQEPGCIAPVQGGGLVMALRDGVYRARSWEGPLARLAAAPFDAARLRFNDGKCDPQGRFWAGSYVDARDAPLAGLYRLAGSAMHPVLDGVLAANGLAWSPDARTLYWADTAGHRVRAWDFDSATGAVSRERGFARFDAKPAGWAPGQGLPYGGRPDGAAVDQAGNYWVAMYEGARLLQLSPAGEVLRDIAVPAQCPTMPCFGGDDLRTLYLTTARHHRSAAELAAWPLSGSVLSLRVDVPGLPVNFFQP
jgi:sugar lactone lactonase YvrE